MTCVRPLEVLMKDWMTSLLASRLRRDDGELEKASGVRRSGAVSCLANEIG